MPDEYIEKIKNIEKEVALTNQFNQEVVKPFVVDVKKALSENPTRREFEDLKKRVDSKVSRKEAGVGATVATTLIGILSFIFSNLRS